MIERGEGSCTCPPDPVAVDAWYPAHRPFCPEEDTIMSNAPFWAAVRQQLAEIREAKSADDVVRILAPERNPYGSSQGVAGDGFFAGSGGDDTLYDALDDAGWSMVWQRAAYWYAMRAPDESVITYCEGDVYKGDKRP